MAYLYRDLTFLPTRVRFGEAHGIRPDESVPAAIGRLARFAVAKKVDPSRLTMVTTSTLCDFLGISVHRWRHLASTAAKSPLGTPPPPRFPGAAKRGPGVADIWCLELDIVPWLLETDDGRALLACALACVKDDLAARVAGVRSKGARKRVLATAS